MNKIRFFVGYILCCWLGICITSLAQDPAKLPDTTRQMPVIRPGTTLPADTLAPETVQDSTNFPSVGADSTVVMDTVSLSARANAAIKKIVPRRSAMLSLAVPGLGQIANGQPWKVPIIYAGFATFGYLIFDLTSKYQDYLAGYTTAYNLPNVPGQDPFRTKTAFVRGREVSLNNLKSNTDYFRRWRDYNLIFTALFWGLNVVDANVTAHLKTFDISDSLTLKYAPTVMPSLTGFVPGVKLTMAFKK